VKVLIVTNMAPFLWGGAEELAVHLERNLIAAGHRAETLRIPFQWEPAQRIVSQMLMVRTFELTNVDRVIALKFPAYTIRHPGKTLWLLHQYRQAYDLHEAGHTNLKDDATGEEVRRLIREADDQTFRESRKIFTNSQVTSDRLKKFNGFESEVLLPPVNDPEIFGGSIDKGYVFAGGRINGMKRQHLLIEAMARAPQGLKLIVAGPPDSPDDAARLQHCVAQLGLQDRVKLDMRFLARREYADYINNSKAVAYLPVDEDSFGYVAMEAAMASKPVITTTDSGGVADFVVHEETGWVATPDVAGIADILHQVGASPARARDMGASCLERWNGLEVNWNMTVERLMQ